MKFWLKIARNSPKFGQKLAEISVILDLFARISVKTFWQHWPQHGYVYQPSCEFVWTDSPIDNYFWFEIFIYLIMHIHFDLASIHWTFLRWTRRTRWTQRPLRRWWHGIRIRPSIWRLWYECWVWRLLMKKQLAKQIRFAFLWYFLP